MYYSSGNYEAFARPRKPEGVEKKSAYIIGSGIAGLATACFLIRDAQMPGKNIHVLEELNIAGGACDGINDPTRGFVARGGREMENHFECLWELFRSIPSIETDGISVLDEFYWLNKEDPNYSLERATVKQGQDAGLNNKFGLNDKAAEELVKLFMTREEDLYDKKLTDVFTQDFFGSNFWLYWRSMFAFEEWHSALEMRRYVLRFIHCIRGLPDFSVIKFTRYNQYESLILPMMKYLEKNGVHFVYNTIVSNVNFTSNGSKKIASEIVASTNGTQNFIKLTPDDFVFITNGSCTESSSEGDNDHAPVMNTELGNCWKMWKSIAAQDPSFGHPEVFCSDTEATKWESATITTLDEKIPQYIQKICKRDPFSGKVVSGGIVTVKDSNWLCSYAVDRQPHFREQPRNEVIVWFYGLFPNVPGNYVKKAMKDCTGREIIQEWLYHLGVPTNEIEELSTKSASCVPCMLPYITSFFMPRKLGDRPKVVPDNSTNFAFIGQFAETERDTIFQSLFLPYGCHRRRFQAVLPTLQTFRSEERRVGKACART